MHLKNIDIANSYGVSATAVGNWIENAQSGVNKLELVKSGHKNYVKDSANNRLILQELAERSRNFNRREERSVCVVQDDFFKLFDDSQQFEIIHYLENALQIPHKYTYFSTGADFWDKYAKRGFTEDIANTVTNTHEMLKDEIQFISKQIDKKTKVNIIDIGVGNAYPVMEFLKAFHKKQLINQYIALDFSQDIIDTALGNINKWFGKEIATSSYIRDISCDKIYDILTKASINSDNTKTVNLVLFLGSTIENFNNWKEVLFSIARSLGKNDYLLLGQTLNNKAAKLFFDLGAKEDSTVSREDYYSDWQELLIPNLIGLRLKDYQIQLRYDEIKDCRFMYLVPEKTIEIQFKNDNYSKTITLHKGDKIKLWQHKHHTIGDIVNSLSEAGLNMLSASTSKDQAQVLTVSKFR